MEKSCTSTMLELKVKVSWKSVRLWLRRRLRRFRRLNDWPSARSLFPNAGRYVFDEHFHFFLVALQAEPKGVALFRRQHQPVIVCRKTCQRFGRLPNASSFNRRGSAGFIFVQHLRVFYANFSIWKFSSCPRPDNCHRRLPIFPVAFRRF